jgi:FkbM family methyltransferase
MSTVRSSLCHSLLLFIVVFFLPSNPIGNGIWDAFKTNLPFGITLASSTKFLDNIDRDFLNEYRNVDISNNDKVPSTVTRLDVEETGLSVKSIQTSPSVFSPTFASSNSDGQGTIHQDTLSSAFSTSSSCPKQERFDMYERIYNMAGLGYIDANRVQYVLDVGAFQGEFSSTLRSSGRFPNAQYILVEGNNRFESLYQSLRFPYIISLVGDQDGEEVTYYRADPKSTGLETGNSIFREETRFFENPIIEKRISYTIDSMLEHLGLQQEAFQILKIDVQGSEIRALRGAKKLIARSPQLLIITEASFVPYNGMHSPTFFDLALEMEKLNFKMVDILGYSEATFSDRKATMPIQFDVAWIHSDRVGWANKQWTKRNYHVDIVHADT